MPPSPGPGPHQLAVVGFLYSAEPVNPAITSSLVCPAANLSEPERESARVEEPQGYSRPAVQRTTPIAMLLYSLIVGCFASEGCQHYRPLNRSWYRASFADMLLTLRRQSADEQIIPLGLSGPGSRRIKQIFDHVLCPSHLRSQHTFFLVST